MWLANNVNWDYQGHKTTFQECVIDRQSGKCKLELLRAWGNIRGMGEWPLSGECKLRLPRAWGNIQEICGWPQKRRMSWLKLQLPKAWWSGWLLCASGDRARAFSRGWVTLRMVALAMVFDGHVRRDFEELFEELLLVMVCNSWNWKMYDIEYANDWNI